jgi:hypothetical protein
MKNTDFENGFEAANSDFEGGWFTPKKVNGEIVGVLAENYVTVESLLNDETPEFIKGYLAAAEIIIEKTA